MKTTHLLLSIIGFYTMACTKQELNHEDSTGSSLQKVIYSLENSHQEKCNIKAVFEKGSQLTSNHDIVQFELVDMNKQLFPVNVNDLPLDELIDGQEVYISYIDTFDLNEVHRVGNFHILVYIVLIKWNEGLL